MQHIIKNVLIIVSVLFLAACSGDKSVKEEAKDSTATKQEETAKDTEGLKGKYCFLMTQGRDTTTVNINIINNDDIQGEMLWIPFEQHGASGSLKGKMRENKELELIYSFEIEGSTQSERMVMKIENEKLYIKKGALEADKDGILTIKDESKAEYTKILDKVDCKTY